jgi:multiple sugar transport system ATP-binding protein
MTSVSLTDVSVELERRSILDRISLDVADGTFAAVVGPSGTGKSTLLRAIAGLVSPTSGSIHFDGVDMTRVKPAERDIGMVFQTPALLPNRNVRRNVEFPLELRRETADAIHDRVTAEARAMHIEHLLRRDPAHLSRGEQQLVQIARTMVRSPRVLLLDEPFAPLDAHLRTKMRAEIQMLQRGYGVTTLMATNDPADAMSLASLIVVLGGSPACVIQYGTPADLHDEPATIDVAAATGPLWTLPVRVQSDRDGFWLVHEDAVRLRSWTPALRNRVGSTVTLGVRTPQLVRDERGQATATLRRVIPGSDAGLLCAWGGRMITATGSATAGDVGSQIRLRVGRTIIFDVDDGRRIA